MAHVSVNLIVLVIDADVLIHIKTHICCRYAFLEIRAELHGKEEAEKVQTLAFLHKKVPSVSVR